MQYEQYEGYPDPNDPNSAKGGMFGYPSEMLNRAIANDDVQAFRFYFDRYFNLESEVIGGETLLQHVTRKGAPKIAKALKRMGAKA